MYIILYIRGSIIKGKETGGKRVKSGGKVYSSIYRVYIIEIYKGKQRCGKKVAGKVKNVRKRVFLIFVYRYSIIEKEKGGAKIVYVYLLQNICSLYIDI